MGQRPPRVGVPVGLALGLAVLGMAALYGVTCRVVGGAFVFPLDDAYIHLGVARNLAEHGSWGVNPGEFASASSSPLWTLLLAGAFWLLGPGEHWPLLFNLGALALVLWQADRLLAQHGSPAGARALGLVGLVLLVPLPFLAMLGMEHVLQLGAVLLLLRARAPIGLFLAAALAALVRYESAFVALWMGIFLLGARDLRAALAVWAGPALALGAFGLFSLSQGGFFLPNSLLHKSPVGNDWWPGIVQSLGSSAALLGLCVAVAASGLQGSPEQAQRVRLFIAVTFTHLLLARVGWLYRYEAWLVGWGLLLLVEPARQALRAPRLAGLALALPLLTPLLLRSVEAFRLYPVGARLHADTDVALARWVARDWPDATVAVHDLGAIAWYTDARIVDLVGIGSDEVLRLRRGDGLSDPALSALLRDQGVDLAITGRDLLASRPEAFTELASVHAPFPAGPGRFETVLWAVDPTLQARFLDSLEDASVDWPARVELRLWNELPVDLRSAVLAGAAVQQEGEGLAFYTNGQASFRAPAAGALWIEVEGSEADGRPPRFLLRRTGGEQVLQAGSGRTRMDLGPVDQGEELVLVYQDDLVDAAGADRNLFLRAAGVDRQGRPSRKASILAP